MNVSEKFGKFISALNNSRVIIVLVLLIIAVLIPLILALIFVFLNHPTINNTDNNTHNTQKNPTSAIMSNTKLGIFNQTPIYVSDLNSLALEQYGVKEAKNLTPSNLSILLNTYIERKILDNQNLGDVSTQIAQIEKNTGLTGNIVKYQSLKEKLIATQQKSWSIYSVDFWLPPVEDITQASPERQQQSADVNNALDFAKTALTQGASLYNIAMQITKNYPSIAQSLAINSIMFNNPNNKNTDWNTPVVYDYDKDILDNPFYKTLYAMTSTSPVTKVLSNGNMGGHVIKIVKINNPNGILDNYQNWLKDQESSFVIINDTLKK